MSRFNRWSIRSKLFVMILVILTANFLLLVLLGSTLFQSFYENNKVRELSTTAAKIDDIYRQNTAQSWERFYEQLQAIENRNNEVIIFRLPQDGSEVQDILYHSRMRNMTDIVRIEIKALEAETTTPATPVTPAEDTMRLRRLELPPFVPIFDSEIFAQLPNLAVGETLRNTDSNAGHGGGRISIVRKLEQDIYLMLDTPREYLTETADLAVQYSAFVSIGVLGVGAILLYWLAGRFTRPIREIDTVAQQIANLDFSTDCPVRSGDELGKLAGSINHMSGKLQQSIGVLQQDLARQQETDRMRRQFVSDVSHDFKTPLTLIVGYAEAIRSRQQPERTDEYCDIIADEGHRLSRLVGRLLGLSRLESGMETLELGPFSLNQLLDDTVRSLQLPAGQQGVTITQQLCGELVVQADYHKLCQVVQNLLENAVKYTPQGGSICIQTCEPEPGRCAVSVSNTGSHIAETELESIFCSFYRADQARERSQQSYGLGLAIVQTILGLHGERCTASNTDNGVCFSFGLPTVMLEDE